MKLQTLKGIKKLAGFDVIDMDELREKFPEKFHRNGQMLSDIFENEIRGKKFIYIRHDVGSLSFNFQDGPVGEVGVNGCQYTAMLDASLIIMKELNKKHPSREGSIAIMKLEETIMWLEKRTQDREKRGVEGFSKD